MQQKFNSEISYWLFVPIFCLFSALITTAIIDKAWPMLMIMVCVTAFMVNLLARTCYVIENRKLTIICGFLFKQEIDIENILKIEKTNSPISSPALSVKHRIEITFGKYDTVIISPERRAEFIEALTLINKNISTNL
ncbi:PH domain-containing protein [Emticicia sp. 21SJ11W-3]|uniref:PH domain-containing protein n=1 Tax=Emticicia sp. 21SJ11W-3 TaxID=2916755 RepID=UPI00209C8622|nr:PH domain-containing protein [Emticicia sp. 21SJ11W-3]UTA68000.1 PH domain-containing protein [Emticicia sp. 21SJ11W-3]